MGLFLSRCQISFRASNIRATFPLFSLSLSAFFWTDGQGQLHFRRKRRRALIDLNTEERNASLIRNSDLAISFAIVPRRAAAYSDSSPKRSNPMPLPARAGETTSFAVCVVAMALLVGCHCFLNAQDSRSTRSG